MKNGTIRFTDDFVRGTVFDIQRFCVHDGPGIRTVVYLKGCPLRCLWCANPESQLIRPQIGFFPEKCIGCSSCIPVCPLGRYFAENGEPNWAFSNGCMNCVNVCEANARVVYGEEMSVNEVVSVVKRDLPFYIHSGGGITLSGGEATMQGEFTYGLLKACRKEGIHTALETCGYVDTDLFLKILTELDCLLFDVKHIDDTVHHKFTGVHNELILRNLKAVNMNVPMLIIRFPLIPGVNDSTANIYEMIRFLRRETPGVNKIEILPYHSIGLSKCKNFGMEYMFKEEPQLDTEMVEAICSLFIDAGFEASIGG